MPTLIMIPFLANVKSFLSRFFQFVASLSSDRRRHHHHLPERGQNTSFRITFEASKEAKNFEKIEIELEIRKKPKTTMLLLIS